MTCRVHRHDDARRFLVRAGEWLLRNEAEHNLLLGVLSRLEEPDHGYPPPIYLATVESDGEVVGCAFRTPPHQLGLTRMPLAAIPAVAESARGVYESLEAVLGPAAEAKAFGKEWSRLTGADGGVGMRQGIYQLERLIEPSGRPSGRARTGVRADVPLVASWLRAMSDEIGLPLPEAGETLAERKISTGALLLWEDGEPRSMACVGARTPNGARVSWVYTPHGSRARGYASACVAELTRRQLEAGARFCFLYTDLANTTSNEIYRRLGYELVTEVIEYDFTPAAERRAQPSVRSR